MGIISSGPKDQKDELVDSSVAAMLLGVSKNNLRQIVHRKMLVPQGRHKRQNRFQIADVMALKARRNKLPMGQE